MPVVFRKTNFFLICLFLALPVSADNPITENPVHIYSEIWPPYQVKMKNGELTGLATEQVKQAFDQAGIPYHIIPMRWARALKSIQQQPNTLIYSISRTPEREHEYYWIAKLGQVKTRLLSLVDSEKHINTPQQLTEFVIALKRAEASLDYFLSLGLIPGKHIIFVNDTEQALKLLVAKRVDFYPISEENLAPSLKNTNLHEKQFAYSYTFNELSFDVYLAAHKQSDKAFVQQIQGIFDSASIK